MGTGRRGTDCERISGMLVAYLDGELPGTMRDEVRDHVTGCRECALEESRLRESWDLLGCCPAVTAPEGFAQAVLRRASGARVRFARSRLLRPVLVAAAAVLLALAAGFYLMSPRPGVSDTELEIVRNLDLLESMDVLEEMGDDIDFLEMANLEQEWY